MYYYLDDHREWFQIQTSYKNKEYDDNIWQSINNIYYDNDENSYYVLNAIKITFLNCYKSQYN